MNTPSFSLKRFAGRKAVILAAITALHGGYLLARPAPGSSAAPLAPAAPKAVGLATLDDSAVAAELSSRGINNLLDYYFTLKHTPVEEQNAIKTLGALADLRSTSTKPWEKIKRVKDVAEGIDHVLPTLKDPTQIMTLAGTILEFGVKRDVNNLEYWGEDPVTQAHLKPMSAAVVKLLDAASTSAQKIADDLQKTLKGGNNDPNANRWEQMDNLAHFALYNKNMSVYFNCLALSHTDPARKADADGAMVALKEFDDPASTVQPTVHLMMAKLQMVSGDFAEARKTFGSMWDEKSGISPAPDAFQQYEARYFAVVADILAKDLANARTDKAALDSWTTQTMPTLLAAAKLDAKAIEENNKGTSAAAQMLQWRVHVLEGDLATAPAEKKKAGDDAEAVLLKLRQDRPDMAPIIDQQLVARMPADKVIDDKMAPSLLLALMKKGMNESYKTDVEKPDPVVMAKGIEAAQVLLKRQGTGPQEAEEASLNIALILDRQAKRVEAANAYLDFGAAYAKTSPKKAIESVNRAGYLVFDMKKQLPNAPTGWAELYNRFLPLAIAPPFNHIDLAIMYGDSLRDVKNYKDALKYYRMIPKENANYARVQFKEMLVLDQMLDQKDDPAGHKKTIDELMIVATEVKNAAANPKDDVDRIKGIQATLTLADLSRSELKDPQRALDVLKGFPELVKGLTDEGKTKADVDARIAMKSTLLRNYQVAMVNIYMALHQTDKAVEVLIDLLKNAKGGEGIQLVREVLDQLDKDYARADLAHDIPKMRTTAENEALLTGRLVDWTNSNAKFQQYNYAYAVYDARTQRIAGSLAADPAKKTELLTKAADRYRALQSPAMHQKYIEQDRVKKLIAEGMDSKDPDSEVEIGLAFTEFDLQHYKVARDTLELLLASKKLGTPQVQSTDPKTGELRIVDNDIYWEGTYKFIKSDWEVNQNDPVLSAVAKRSLKNILLRGGIPERWQDEFEDLRKTMVPDFDPNAAIVKKPVAPAAPPATSQPAPLTKK